METKVINIENSLGVILPLESGIQLNELFTVYIVEDKIILSPKRENVYKSQEGWSDYQLSEEDKEWEYRD